MVGWLQRSSRCLCLSRYKYNRADQYRDEDMTARRRRERQSYGGLRKKNMIRSVDSTAA